MPIPLSTHTCTRPLSPPSTCTTHRGSSWQDAGLNPSRHRAPQLQDAALHRLCHVWLLPLRCAAQPPASRVCHLGRRAHGERRCSLQPQRPAAGPRTACLHARLPGSLPTCLELHLLCHHMRPAGLLCGYAHHAYELRREAAVQLGTLPPRYKTSLCEAYYATGRFGGSCAWALLPLCCMLRQVLEASSLPALANSHWHWFTQNSAYCCRCLRGDACPFAHGVDDLRLHAAIRQAGGIAAGGGGLRRPAVCGVCHGQARVSAILSRWL